MTASKILSAELLDSLMSDYKSPEDVKQHRKLTPHRRPILPPSGRDCLCPTNGCARARSGME